MPSGLGEDLRSSSIALRGFEPHLVRPWVAGRKIAKRLLDGPRLGGRRKMRSVSSVVERATFNRVAVGSTPTSSILTPNCSNTFI